MRFNDVVGMRGEVLITSIDEFGNSKILVDDRNLIVLNGRRLVATHVLTGSGAYITDIAFGNGGTAIGDPNVVLQVLSTETTVNSTIPNLLINTDYTFTVDASSLAIPTAKPKLIYTINIPKLNTNVNGKQINEMALMLNTTPTATAFAIKRFSTITKSDSILLNVNWTLFF